jgi:phage shock protein PspC (stress-responsive transcriptional regulator)
MSTEADTTTTEVPGAAPARLRRNRDDRLLAGVCGGLARYFGMNPIIYRIGFVALALVGGAGILLYAVAAVVIPVEGAEVSIAEEFLRRHRDRPVVLIVLALIALCVVSVLSASDAWAWSLAGPFWLLLLLILVPLLVQRVGERDREMQTEGDVPSPPAPKRPSLFLPGLGVLLAAVGLGALLEAADVVHIPLDVALAGLLLLTGALVAVAAVFGRHAWGLALIGLAIAPALAVAAIADVHLRGGFGEQSVRPLVASELEGQYRLGGGELEIDLRALEVPLGETRVRAQVGVGELVVIVPEDVALNAVAHVGMGEASVLGENEDGVDVTERSVDDGFAAAARRLVVDAKVGLGHVEIRGSES